MSVDGKEGGEDDSGLIFRYSREKRLEHAPENVRKAYEQGYMPNKGFFKGLTANSGLRSVLFVILILCALIIGITIFGNPPGSASLDGIDLRLKGFLYDETVYVTLTCTAPSGTDRPVQVHAVISALDGSGSVIYNTEVEGLLREKELVLRTTMPDRDILNLSASVKLNNSGIILPVSVDRK
jgi:hypothetical protein